MKLQEHMNIHAWDASTLAHRARRGNMTVDEAVVQRALAGLPIAATKAQIICDAISKEYGISGNARGQLTPEGLGINVYDPGLVGDDNGTGDGNAIRRKH